MNIKINDVVFDSFPVLETNRLNLRNFTENDANALFLIRSNPVVIEFMDTFVHKTVSDSLAMIGRIHESFNDKTGINWAIELKETNEFAGYCCFHRLDKDNARAEIGYALKHEHWGKGIASEAVKTLIKFAFDTLTVHGIDANVNPKNISSKKLLEKLGFRKEAYFRENYFANGKFLDSEIYCLLESDVNQ